MSDNTSGRDPVAAPKDQYGDPVTASTDSYGDPVVEPTENEHDVVGRAHEGLADAEAARRDAVDPQVAEAAWGEREQREREDSAALADRRDHTAPVVHDASPVEPQTAPAAAPASSVDLDDEDARWAAYAASAEPAQQGTSTARHDDDARTTVSPVAETAVVAGTGAAVAGAGAATTSASDEPTRAYGGPQPIFVQAPEAPRPRGNRGAAGAIGLLAALAFAVLYLAAILGLRLLTDGLQVADLGTAALSALGTWGLWVPTVAFYLGFWFLGALINRGRWGHWVVWGLIVGVVAWAGHLLGVLLAAPFWMIDARESVDLLLANVLAPLAIVAFVLGRELTIWFGAWVSARGRRMTELNAEAQREYERTLEAGPQLSQR
ncbi:ABC transporter [Microbacterium sp. VKM Ac-2923]|uniref:ABC transporter n=1 Tax=Microbacterium sp. VKM Ac-2923 TaxID=2929476 RepID=UPI001FB45CC7|nr:ABC transporter [Microbacterium sp. VKM Ac-2923]MCJ1706319.1 ABC transporter [Microbacterium sp. VKM Ac-2923]